LPQFGNPFYTHNNTSTIDHDLCTFIVHFDSGDFVVNINMIEMVIQIPCPPQYDVPLPLVDYMTVMGVRFEEKDRVLKASTTFCNVHCAG